MENKMDVKKFIKNSSDFFIFKSFKNDKKAVEKLFSLWWYFVLAIVGLGIVVGVYIFYSADVDTRQVESLSLYNKITNCLISRGQLIDEFVSDDFDIFIVCNLNKETIWSDDFYFNVSLFDSNGNLLKTISEGVHTFEKDCKIGSKIIAKEFPKCTEKKENVVLYKGNEKSIATIYILAGSNHRGRKQI